MELKKKFWLGKEKEKPEQSGESNGNKKSQVRGWKPLMEREMRRIK